MEVKEMELRQGLSIQEKLRILADAAKYVTNWENGMR